MRPKRFACLITILILGFGCVSSQNSGNLLQKIAPENSLPPDQLAYYSDTFDSLNEDLWKTILWVGDTNALTKHFKAAEVKIVNGKLVLRNQKNAFSKARISSTFLLAGDFDFQVDLKYHVSDVNNVKLQAVMWLNRIPEVAKNEINTIALLFDPTEIKFWILKGKNIQGKKNSSIPVKLNSTMFDGQIRFVRNSGKLYTFLKKNGSSNWKKLYKMNFIESDISVGFNIRNFDKTQSDDMHSKGDSISLEIDNFKIHAAEKIIESDI